MLRLALVTSCTLALASCGISYFSPSVNPLADSDNKVRVVSMTPESVLVANRSSYSPKTLPAIFFQTAGTGSAVQSSGAAPEAVFAQRTRPAALETRVPPAIVPAPYQIGIGDVVLLATPRSGSTVEQLTGLLAAQNSRQGYTVQDDGAIAIPNVGRVQVANLTLEQAEDLLFQRLVENQIEPTFSLEIAEFNSKRVSVGGAVANPRVVPVTLTPVYLEEVLVAAGGITVPDQDFASVRIYRDGTLYQIPVSALYSDTGLQRIQLTDGDSVFVDTSYELDLAEAYFEQQITLAEFRQQSRSIALNQLRTEVDLRRGALNEARSNFQTRAQLGDEDRDHVYLTGEVGRQSRFTLPYGRPATLADALYSSGGVPTETADVREVYVLRASTDPREFGAVTAWNLDGRDATNFLLATRFEMRPNDVVFVAEQPVTRWGRVIRQITPALISSGVRAAGD